jgi:transposase-like protein
MRQRKEEMYRVHYAAFNNEGITVSDYCRRNDLVTSTFSYWVGKFRREEAATTEMPLKFKQVVLSKGLSGEIQISKSNGTEIVLPISIPFDILERIVLC